MKHWVWALYEKHRRSSAFAIAATFGLGVSLAIFWLAEALLLVPATASLQKAVMKKNGDLRMAQAAGGTKKGVPGVQILLTGYPAVAQFQEELVSAAQASGCTITQFSPDQKPSPYISHYGIQAADFSVFHLRVMLTGNLGGALSVLQRLCDEEGAFELVSLSVSPQMLADSKDANRAAVSMAIDVICKTESATSAGGTS